MPLDLPSVIGHRGAADSAPENTLAGFRRAAELGARWVEFDLRLTGDGQPVLFHDDGLRRITGASGRVADKSLEEIRDLDAGAWFSPAFAGEAIPTLAEALTLLATLGLGINIEIKPDQGREDETARIGLGEAQRLWPDHLPVPLISSFSHAALHAAQAVVPHWPRGLLASRLPRDWPDLVADYGCSSINLDHRHLTPEVVDKLRLAGLDVLAYTVNDPRRAVTLWNWGVLSVFSDCPDRLLKARQ
ncbi:glycerophosphodiester phosphodiesterase [Telmatospirillum sp. J64-1]|uniref:glycerophosphodiester phosphodiesterase n=1 Tax=Telmatospirillum sp. J64-1 TaxID=2502183 RepID=UPI00115C4E6A|nr:glycerophosphodiester phosphodiesterase [Telmatospirillum sp. J64-1]